MTQDRIKISFCIPTFNRVDYLLKSIDSIYGQLTQKSITEIEIVISDNASTDSTKDKVGFYMSQRPHASIKFYTNPVNIGMDGNFLKCFSKATGEFVCLVSDDDFLLPGTVDKLLDIVLENDSIDAVFMNSFALGGGATADEVLLFDANRIIEVVGSRIFHIGALLFRRSIFEQLDYEVYRGTFISQSFLYLDVIKQGNGVYFPQMQFFHITENNSSGGYGFFTVFVTNFGKLMDYGISIGFNADVVRRIESRHLRYFLIPFIIDFRLNNSHVNVTKNFNEGFRLIWRRYRLNPAVFWGVIPAIYAPRVFWLAVRFLMRALRAFGVLKVIT